jgi:hypothetical protein
MSKVLLVSLLLLITYPVFLALNGNPDKHQKTTSAPVIIDTVFVRLDNKPYFTVKYNHRWTVLGIDTLRGEAVTFHPFDGSDTLSDISLTYINNKQELINMIRKGDTIKNCLLADLKISFYDFTDPVEVKKSDKPEKNRNGTNKNQGLTTSKSEHKTQGQKKIHKINRRNSVPFSKPLVFIDCVFGPVVADTVIEQYQDLTQQKNRPDFKENVMFVNCNFIDGFEMSNCDFEKNFYFTGQLLSKTKSVIDNCTFDSVCYIYSTPPVNQENQQLNINLCTYYSPFIFPLVDNVLTHVNIERCKFNDIFSFGKSMPDTRTRKFHIAFSGVNYTEKVIKYANWYAAFLDMKFSKEFVSDNDTLEDFTHNDRVLCNVNLYHCKAKNIDIANCNFKDCSLEDISISRSIDVTGSNFVYSSNYSGKMALEDIGFSNDRGIIYAGYKTFLPEAFKLSTYLSKVAIHPLVHNYFDSTTDFLEDNSTFYNNIKDYIEKRFTNQDIINSYKARYDHEKSMWALEYNAAHLKRGVTLKDRFISFFPWVGGHFLEATVSTGYKGEWKFALWVVFIIITFSFLYYFNHKGPVIDYLNSKFNKENENLEKYETLKIYGPVNRWRDFFRCLWFSTMVFIDPRLPISFFNLKRGIFGLVLMEWILGLTAITLFLIFLASNYAFVRSLIGI